MKHLKTFESYDSLTPELIKSIKTACDELIEVYNREDKKFDYEFTYDTLRTIHKFIPNYDYEKLEDHVNQVLEDGFEVTDVCDIALDFMKENPIYFSKQLKKLNDISGILENLTPFKEECIRDMCYKTYREYLEEDKDLDSEFTYEVRDIFRRYLPKYNWRKIEDHIIQYGIEHDDFTAEQICDVAINFVKENPMYSSKKINKIDKAVGVFEKADSYNDVDFEKIYKEHRKLLDKFMRKMEKNPEEVTSFDYVDILFELFKKHIGEDKDWEKFYDIVIEYSDELARGGGDLFDDMFNFMVTYLEENPLFFSKKLDDMNDKSGVFETYHKGAVEYEDGDGAKELWEELYKEYRETVFMPSQTDDVEYSLSHFKGETFKDTENRNLYIRSKTLDFFKQKNFSTDWKTLNNTLSWKDLNYDIETNFEIMFDYVKDYFSNKHPDQIHYTPKLRDFNKNTGILEKNI